MFARHVVASCQRDQSQGVIIESVHDIIKALERRDRGHQPVYKVPVSPFQIYSIDEEQSSFTPSMLAPRHQNISQLSKQGPLWAPDQMSSPVPGEAENSTTLRFMLLASQFR